MALAGLRGTAAFWMVNSDVMYVVITEGDEPWLVHLDQAAARGYGTS